MSDGAEQTRMDRKHVFAVNGVSEFLDVIRELLQEEKYNVTTTNFVPNTYQQIAALHPDLLIVDLAVGERAGWDLLRQLVEEVTTRDIPVIVVSTSPEYLDKAQEFPEQFGGQRFMRKPLDLDDVVDAVHQLIGGA